MENTIKIIAIGKGGYEQGTIDMEVVSFADLDEMTFREEEEFLAKMVRTMRCRIIEQETINAKLKNKKK